MKICIFSAEEIKTMLAAMDYVDFCLENVVTSPDGFDEETFSSLFVSSRDKLLNYSPHISFSTDELTTLAHLLRHYLYTPQSFESTRTPPEDAQQALAAIQKIEHTMSA